MPDHPRAAPTEASAARTPFPVRVAISGIAAGTGQADARMPAAQRALREAGVDPHTLTAVISIGADPQSREAVGVCARLGIGAGPGVRALDMVDDGCGVPSSIALGASILAQWGGAVLLTVDDGALVLRGMPLAPPRVGSGDAPGRRTADVELTHDRPRTAVEQVLVSVGDEVPIVAVVSGGIRLAPGRRFVGVCLAPTRVAPIEGLLQARDEGHAEVVLVTANALGRAAAVMCHLDRSPGRPQRQ